MLALSLFSGAAVDSDVVRTSHYDILVRNIVVGPEGKPWLDQVGGIDLIDGFYCWQWWRLTRDTGTPICINGKPTLSFRCKKTGLSYKITATCHWTIHTAWDLEIADREHFPQTERRGL